METLVVVPCSKSSGFIFKHFYYFTFTAEQRAGRAGRLRPGKCFVFIIFLNIKNVVCFQRLYPETEFNKLGNTTIPEIQRCDLASVILRLKALGVQSVLRFNYLSRPSSTAMIHALQLLFALKAIDEDGLLNNPLGLQMAELPLSPMHAKALISSGNANRNCLFLI